jgi:SWI/SNF-related matrix-associated actin-dependent regulator 1 of chromatin subfamily A
MNLTFTDRKFRLTNFSAEFAPKSSLWVFNHANNSYETKNVEAARAFKRYASNTVKNIFNKLIIAPVPCPGVAPLVPSGLALKPFQAERGVPFLLSQNKTYLAHEPGLGKSAQFVTAVNTKPGRALIVCPSFLKINWAREITKWSTTDFPNIQIVPETNKADRVDWSADYVICPQSMLTKPWVMQGILNNEFRYKAVDEVQNFKTPGAARSVALWGGRTKEFFSPGLMFDCEHEVYLSGTPLLSRPIEIYPILFGAAPETVDFMSYNTFGFRYCGAWQDDRGQWKFTGSSREAELHKRLTSKFMQIVKKTDVLKDLPGKIRSVLVMDKDPRDAETRELDQQLLKEFDGEQKRPATMGQYARLHHANGRAKINWVVDLIKYYLQSDENEKIILYGFHRDVCEKLAAGLSEFNPDVVLGGLKDSARTAIVDRFQNGRGRLIVGNEAMNLGLTLTKATRTVFAEYSTLPKVNVQAEDRANRIGSENVTYCQYVVLPNSLDEVRLKSFFKRENAINKIIF